MMYSRLPLLILLLSLCPLTDSAPVLYKQVTSSAPNTETSLTEEDFTAANHLHRIDGRQRSQEKVDEPWMGSKSEGDIDIEDIAQFVEASNLMERAAIRGQYKKWRNGIIPYTISSMYSSEQRARIARAMDDFHMKTCIRFVPRREAVHEDYVYIVPEKGCSSYVGRGFGRRKLSLAAGCLHHGTIVHELMHAVGFFHEQSRDDRDRYIAIWWWNIRPGYKHNFDKYSLLEIDHLGETYDYESVMHYPEWAFAKAGQTTIFPYFVPSSKIGNRVGFSDGDIRRINKLYDCRK